jgi:hypothetical protein
MRVVATIVAVLSLQGSIARAQPTQQCTVQSDYPSPLDANGKPIGALVQVDLSSQVGVVLDDLPAAKRRGRRAVAAVQGTDYWKARAIGRSRSRITGSTTATTTSAIKGPCRFRIHRLDILVRHGATGAIHLRKKKSVVDAVFVDYRMQDVILTDADSPNASTGNRLNRPGDTVTCPSDCPGSVALVPTDGPRLLRRVRLSRGSVDPGGEAWYFYDDTCTAKSAEPLDSAAFACKLLPLQLPTADARLPRRACP